MEIDKQYNKKNGRGRQNLIKIQSQIMNENEISDKINEYFTATAIDTIRSEYGFNLVQQPNPPKLNCSFKFKHISYNDIMLSINKMNNTKSCGPDEISLLTIKRNLEIFVLFLFYLFNLSIITGIFPERFKESFIIPIHKSE